MSFWRRFPLWGWWGFSPVLITSGTWYAFGSTMPWLSAMVIVCGLGLIVGGVVVALSRRVNAPGQ